MTLKGQWQKAKEKIIKQGNLVLQRLSRSGDKNSKEKTNQYLAIDLALRSVLLSSATNYTEEQQKGIDELKERLIMLDKKQMYILKLRYEDGKTESEIANDINVSQPTASRYLKQILKTLSS